MSSAEMIVRNTLTRMSVDERIHQIWSVDVDEPMSYLHWSILRELEPEACSAWAFEQQCRAIEGNDPYDGMDDDDPCGCAIGVCPGGPAHVDYCDCGCHLPTGNVTFSNTDLYAGDADYRDYEESLAADYVPTPDEVDF